MNRTVLKRWFDKLPALPRVDHEIAPNRLKIVTWEDLMKLEQRIEMKIKLEQMDDSSKK